MAYVPKILAFAGSLRADSQNKKLVQIAAAGARSAGAEVTYVDLRDYPMPVFDEDLEAAQGMPENARKFKELMLANHGLLIAAPEYNSSITAALKNAIDWASRKGPGHLQEWCFTGKVASIMSASPGGLGGLRGLVHVRAILGNIDVIVLPDQVAIPRAFEAFDAGGKLKDQQKHAAVEQLGANVARMLARLRA